MKRLVYILLFVWLVSLPNPCTIAIMAQGQYHVKTWTETAKKKEYRAMQYALFRNMEKARTAVSMLKELTSKRDSMSSESWKRECEALKVKFRKTKANGELSVPASPGNVVLICTYNPDVKMKPKDMEFYYVVLKEGQTDYDVAFQGKLSGDHVLQEVVSRGKQEKKKKASNLPSINGDSIVSFRIHIDLDPGYANEKCRLVVQPYAVEMDTEDTVDYVPGLVMEGVEFHKLQVKRMRFNYKKNDAVAFALIKKPLWHDERVYLDTLMYYRKRDVRKDYKIPYVVEISDLNHVIYCDTVAAPQNLKDIYKLINYGKDNPLLNAAEKTERIHKFNTFKGGFVQYASGQLTGDAADKVKGAMDYLIATAPENKAVIYTEARDLLHVSYADNLNLINAMSNDNPKKWYLRGIIEADKEAEDITRKEKGYIPEYLCYFNHAFELKPAYKWTYFKDGQVPDEMRTKYKYNKHDIHRYREMFNAKVDLKDTKKVVKPVIDGEGEIQFSGEDE